MSTRACAAPHAPRPYAPRPYVPSPYARRPWADGRHPSGSRSFRSFRTEEPQP